MNDNWYRIIIGTLLFAIFIAFTTVTIKANLNDHQSQQKLCESYCNCIETQDCLYTFDYKDIKNCDCGDD